MKTFYKYSVLLFTFALSACGDFLEPQSQSEYEPQLVQSLEELLLGESYMGPGDGTLTPILGVFDDDVALRPDFIKYSTSEEGKVNQIRLAFTWSKDMIDYLSGYNIYGTVYQKIVGCNAALDYLDDVQGTEEQKNDVRAQALVLRSYFYFYLVNLYGKPYNYDKHALGVPLKLTSELISGGIARNTVEEVYNQIVGDLLEAERLLKTLPDSKKLRRNNRVSLPFTQLLLSRVYLYMENWEKALEYADLVMQDSYGFKLQDLNSIEEPNPYVTTPYPNYYTLDNPEILFLFDDLYGRIKFPLTMVLMESDKGFSSKCMCVVSEDLIKMYSNTDLRKSRYLVWERIGNGEEPNYRVAASKMEVGQMYNPNIVSGSHWGTAFRLSEAYLNAAEAAAMLFKQKGDGNMVVKCKKYIDDLRQKRFAPESFVAVETSNADELIKFARDERRRELCFENHRWFDLRRYGMPEIKHTWYDKSGETVEHVLADKDLGYTLLIPKEAFGLNPGLIQNESRK